ncbi:MAG: hypothetical protein L0I76_38175 [Pseudonocardia sp.]|nr:hypothetical protein [Pseudonocardia sp.]
MTTAADLHPVDRAAIGPQVPGGIYRNGYWGKRYRVDEVLVGDAARAEIPGSDWAIVETELDGLHAGRQRVHCTAWDGKRDSPVPGLAAALARDDAAEDRGMHAEGRETCWKCQSWADHAHDWETGKRITLDEYLARKARTG